MEVKTGRKKEQNKGREIIEKYIVKSNQVKVNKKVKIKEYKGGKRAEGKHLTVKKYNKQKKE
jgi:hypothetical protein